MGKERANAAGSELFDRAGLVVCRVEIARAVKGKANWYAQSAAGKDRPDSAGGEFLNGVVVRNVEVTCAIEGEASWAVQSAVGEARADAVTGELHNRVVAEV